MPLAARPEAVLIDLAGVLHIEDEAIPGAVEALRRLRASRLPLRFLTNTTRSPRQRIVASLRQMGFEIAPDEIQTAVRATRHLVEQRGMHPHYLVHPDIVEEVGPSHPAPDAVVLGDAGRGHEVGDGLRVGLRRRHKRGDGAGVGLGLSLRGEDVVQRLGGELRKGRVRSHADGHEAGSELARLLRVDDRIAERESRRAGRHGGGDNGKLSVGGA